MRVQPVVLVVDDERNFCRILEAKLRRSGWEVETAGTAAEASAALLRRTFQAIVLDVRLPDADGLKLLADIRGLAGGAPVVLMTAYEEEGLRARGIEAGAAEVLYKPFDLDYLVGLLDRLVRRSATPPAGSPLASVIERGQAVVLAIDSNAGPVEYPGRVSDRAEDTFAVAARIDPLPGVGSTVEVRAPGEDGLYTFRARVLGAGPLGGTLSLAKPDVISRVQRRAAPRRPLPVPVSVEVLAADGSAAPLRVVSAQGRDLSLAGMGLDSPEALAPGQPVRLHWQSAAGEIVVAPGSVVRCQQAGDEQFHLGVRFGALTEGLRGRIASALQRQP